MPTIGIIGAGAMGSAVGQRLSENGARVVTCLDGRSDRTVVRAEAAGMERVSLAELATADLILSIVPPSDALAVARSLVDQLSMGSAKPPYVDCNAVSPATMAEVASILAGTGCEVLDGCIIGGPPTSGGPGPTFYVSADMHQRTELLTAHQLRVRRIDGEIGAASALKMVYAGISKGSIGLGAAMLLAAAKAGAAESLRSEMAASMPDVQTRLRQSVPSMYPKAYRWVGEMLEIAEFLGPGNPAATVFRGMADVFASFAEDLEGEGEIIDSVNEALGFSTPQV
jgi:3-hydroxyisobutyrate dehydrogenase-like beta-hydroxyacid dehydrogenase